MRKALGVPGVVGLCSAALVLALSGPHSAEAADPARVAIPRELAGYSHLTGTVSDSPPGPAVALYQHGFGVELLDFPQAVVLGADGDAYRRVDVAEDRAGPETQGDPAPMLLSPDGTRVAVGDHDTDAPDVVVVDLATGATTTHSLPTGRSVMPIAWSRDGRQLAHLLSPAPTNPHRGDQVVGEVAILDLADDRTVLLEDAGPVATAAFSPDGSQLVVDDGAGGTAPTVVDLRNGSRRAIPTTGVLAGPAAWSPDGRLLALTVFEPAPVAPESSARGIPTGLTFVDPSGRGRDAPAPLPLALPPGGQVLGWSSPDSVLTLLDGPPADAHLSIGTESYALAAVPLDGRRPRTLMRISGLQDFGVSRFQLATATTDGLRVVSPVEIDRGGWPLWLRAVLALLLGLLAWAATRAWLRAVRRRVRLTPTPAPAPG